jgi:hypothetical protein
VTSKARAIIRMTIESIVSLNYPVNLFSLHWKYECFFICLPILNTFPTLLSETSKDPGSLGLEDSDGRALVIA